MMSESSQHETPAEPQRRYSAPAVGLTFFAGIMMIMLGAFQWVAGVAALLDDPLFVSTRAWLFAFDTTRWGWIHLVLGLLLIASGIALFGGLVWARVVAAAVAMVSAVGNFMWLPWYPIWGVLMVALDVCIIWAVTVHGRDIARV